MSDAATKEPFHDADALLTRIFDGPTPIKVAALTGMGVQSARRFLSGDKPWPEDLVHGLSSLAEAAQRIEAAIDDLVDRHLDSGFPEHLLRIRLVQIARRLSPLPPASIGKEAKVQPEAAEWLYDEEGGKDHSKPPVVVQGRRENARPTEDLNDLVRQVVGDYDHRSLASWLGTSGRNPQRWLSGKSTYPPSVVERMERMAPLARRLGEDLSKLVVDGLSAGLPQNLVRIKLVEVARSLEKEPAPEVVGGRTYSEDEIEGPSFG